MGLRTTLILALALCVVGGGCSLHAVRPYERARTIQSEREAQARMPQDAAEVRHLRAEESFRDARQDDVAGRR